MPTITEVIASLSGADRARKKSEELVSRLAAQVVRYTYTYNGVDIKIESAPEFVNGCLSVNVSASTGSGKNKVQLPVDNPYLFFNPPILIVTTPPVFGPDGHVLTGSVHTENPLEALKTMLGDAVLLQARRMGWAG